MNWTSTDTHSVKTDSVKKRSLSTCTDSLTWKWSTTPSRLRGMSLCRIVIGLAGVNFYISNIAQRDLLWGPNGYINSAMFRIQSSYLHIHSLYSVSTSNTYFQCIFFGGLFVAVLFTICGGRSLTVLHAVFLWSIYGRNQQIMDGGDNLAAILVLLLIFVITDAHYSPMARWRQQRMRTHFSPSRPRLTVLVHNAAVFLVTFQVAILYFCAGAWKLSGGLWEDGTAMYYVNHATDFRFLSLGWLVANSMTTTIITYFAIVANLAFPFGLLTKRMRIATVSMAMTMHLGIIMVMGLTGFGITMIGADLGCLSDDEYDMLRRAATAMRSKFGARRRDATKGSADSSPPPDEEHPRTGPVARELALFPSGADVDNP